MNYASVNSVYNLCQEILAKDERGFLTPNQFNALAKDAQSRLVNKLVSGFTEGMVLKDRYLSKSQGLLSKTDSIRQDLLPLLRRGVTLTGTANVFDFPSDYMVYEGRDSIVANGYPVSVISDNKVSYHVNSYLSAPTATNAIAEMNFNTITIYPASITSGVKMTYYKIPQGSTIAGAPSTQYPTWGYTTSAGTSVYNPATSINFELPVQCEIRLTQEVLQLAGLSLREFEVAEFANRESAEMQNEKDN
jgi:hypothetical protein